MFYVKLNTKERVTMTARKRKVSKIIKKHQLDVSFHIIDNLFLSVDGKIDHYLDGVKLCLDLAKSKLFKHVINNLKALDVEEEKIYQPSIKDKKLEGLEYDVAIIGGGVIGSSVAMQLSIYPLKVIVLEKEEDIALEASSRNDGCIHPGIDLKKNSLKLYHLRRSLKMIKPLSEQLDFDYAEDGQMIVFSKWGYAQAAKLYLSHKVRSNNIPGYVYLKKEKLWEKEPNLDKKFKYGFFFPQCGAVSPYEMSIALMEYAHSNGVEVSLNTCVEGFSIEDNRISEIKTNRGKMRAKLVINAAGVFAEDIAKLAHDHYFSIHPRKGTDIILDKDSYPLLSTSGMTALDSLKARKKSHSKGGGVIPTVDKNALIGPNAIETPYKDDYSVDRTIYDALFKKYQNYMPSLNKGMTLTYFTGVRAPTYEEDFIVERGHFIQNIIHAAGIQSPGLTSAPSIGLTIKDLCLEYFHIHETKKDYIKTRKRIPLIKDLNDEEKEKLIKSDSSFGKICCRCEEISLGSVKEAIRRCFDVPTVDAIKKRVRVGMGKCQGGFCRPEVMMEIAKSLNIDLKDVRIKGEESNLLDIGGHFDD